MTGSVELYMPIAVPPLLMGGMAVFGRIVHTPRSQHCEIRQTPPYLVVGLCEL